MPLPSSPHTELGVSRAIRNGFGLLLATLFFGVGIIGLADCSLRSLDTWLAAKALERQEAVFMAPRGNASRVSMLEGR